MDRKSEKTLVALGEAELSTVAGGLFDQDIQYRPVFNLNFGANSQLTGNSGDGSQVNPIQAKQVQKFLTAIGVPVEAFGVPS